MNERRSDGTSFSDQPIHGWPRRRVIWSCLAERGPLLTRYWEHFPEKNAKGEVAIARAWRRRFSILWRPAEWSHRLELEKPTWTLVVRFRRRRMWGFFTEGGWMDWQAYGKEWCD